MTIELFKFIPSEAELHVSYLFLYTLIISPLIFSTFVLFYIKIFKYEVSYALGLSWWYIVFACLFSMITWVNAVVSAVLIEKIIPIIDKHLDKLANE